VMDEFVARYALSNRHGLLKNHLKINDPCVTARQSGTDSKLEDEGYGRRSTEMSLYHLLRKAGDGLGSDTVPMQHGMHACRDSMLGR
jgi:hypothetical protein